MDFDKLAPLMFSLCIMVVAGTRPNGYIEILLETLSCNNNYCDNGGTCVIEDRRPVCKCSPYFNGSRCETCVCAHGHCSTERENKCICNRLYKGTFCNVSVCRNYCLNGGTCVNCTVNEETWISECQDCICKPGTAGSRCTKIRHEMIENQEADRELTHIIIPVLVAVLVLVAIAVLFMFRRRRNNQIRYHLLKTNPDLKVSNTVCAAKMTSPTF